MSFIVANPNTPTRNTIQPDEDTDAGLIILPHSASQSAPLLCVGGPPDASVFQVPGVFGGSNASFSALHDSETPLQLYGSSATQLVNLLEVFPDPNGALITAIGPQGQLTIGTALRTEVGVTPKVGFLGAPAVIKQTGASAAAIAAITDPNAKAAVSALQTALANLGLVTSPA